MKKWIIRIFGFLIILAIAAFIFRGALMDKIMEVMVAPDEAFENYKPPPALDYADATNWAALPEIEDGADRSPAEINDLINHTGIPVFYVHPTTYIEKSSWNAPLKAGTAKEYIDNFVMPDQASVFAGCCDVHAPHYRQATLWSYFDETGSGVKAREFAYKDVERAFDHFLAQIGNDDPFILAGHSQGAEHLVSLLKNRVTGTALAGRMVAAYPVGIGIDPKDMAKTAADIPVCASPTQTRCYITWNALGAKAEAWPDYPGAVCVNPLSWRADEVAVPADDNPGSIAFSAQSDRFETGLTGAQCMHDRLLVGPIISDIYADNPVNFGKDNFHIMDYNLFYASIRQNAIDRVEAYLAE